MSRHSMLNISILLLSTVIGYVLMDKCKNTCKPKSCLDIYKEDNRNPSGEYTIYQKDQAIRVYCSFEGDYGFTYISRKFSGSDIDLKSLYSTQEFAKIRIIKSNGVQSEVTVENLLSYKSSTSLSFNFNSHTDYQGPRPKINGLHPYVFLGFLPISLAKNHNIQGYRAAGKDFTFKNCDANPNSYIVFYLNPKLEKPGNVGWTNNFMTEWITHSTPLKYPDSMDSSFYMDWEMHMGGCGGLTTSHVVSGTKAALGLPFAISKPEKKEDIAKICADGITKKPPQFYFPSTKGDEYFIQCDEHGGSFLMKCKKKTVWCQKKLTCDHSNEDCDV